MTESSIYPFEISADRELTATFEPCQAERVLSPMEVDTQALFETCQTLIAGSGFRVTGPDGDVTFRAGQRIILTDGFSVASGARFRAVITQ